MRNSPIGLLKPSITQRVEPALLPITFKYLLQLQHLLFHHRNPFDRLLIAQAFPEELMLSRGMLFLAAECLCLVAINSQTHLACIPLS